MNLTIILGNGFDIKLGLKTSYTDFYNAFLAHNQSTWNVFDEAVALHPVLCDMMKSKQLPYWSDLELLLGRSVNKFNSLDVLRTEKIYLEEELGKYLTEEQKRIQIVDAALLRNRMDDTILRLIALFGWGLRQTAEAGGINA